MIDINSTFFIQLANFLIMIFFMNHFLFKPILNMVERRREKMRSLNSDAAKYRGKTEKVMEDYKIRLANMRKEASAMLAAARKEGLLEQEDISRQVRKEFNERIETAKKEIGQEAREAEEALKGQVSAISGNIAMTLLGREL